MKKRLFVAINLPENIRDGIQSAVEPLKNKLETVRFSSAENWHITLSFLGYQERGAIPAISAAVQKTAERFQPPLISLNKMVYGPTDKHGKMIWLIDKNREDGGLSSIAKFLWENLKKEGVEFKIDYPVFSMHITLARFDKLPPPRPHLPELNLKFSPNSIDVMESSLKKTGAEYAIIEGFKFHD